MNRAGRAERFTGAPVPLYRAPMFYQRHLFFCTNIRDDGRPACGDHDAQRLRDYAKDRVKALGLSVAGGVRVNSAGCLGRCAQGPALVIYPDGVWYTYRSERDLDEIIEEHVLHGRVVDHLRI
jgi:(2Fe-2S) ferredoxin